MWRSRIRSAALTLVLTGGLALAATPAPPAEANPTIAVSTVVKGLAYPWDLTWVGSLMVFDERGGRVWSKSGSAAPRRVSIPLPKLYVHSEGGLLGLVADPAAGTNRRFYTCQSVATSSGAPLDVRVLRWRLTSNTTAVSDGDPLITGLPLNPDQSPGRHSGCRLRFGADGKLYVGTGDAAEGTNPQNLASLGGKILRVNSNGSIPPDNPFYARGGRARYVWNYGHRNVQGLALRPGTSQLWSVEQGTGRDDEVNLSSRGANYGWDPVPGYDESTPMTDVSKFPSAVRAKWSSGDPTLATSGGTFLSGSGWGSWQGAMAVGILKANGIRLLFLDPTGAVVRVEKLAAAQSYKRIRTVQQGPDGALYFTTSNGSQDIIGRIAPTATAPVVPAGTNVAPVGVSAARSGSNLYAFVRSTGNRIFVKRSRDDGRTWGGWLNAQVSSTTAPSATSSASGRIDLVTGGPSGSTIHTWYVDGVRRGSSNLGGILRVASVSSQGNGSLDVFGMTPQGTGCRRHFNGTTWSTWQSLGGRFTSMIGASANPSTGATLITGRSSAGGTWERTVTATSNGAGWVRVSGSLWSGRALGDARTGVGVVAVSSGSDHNAVVQRGSLVLGVRALYNSDPDVVTRPDGSWIMFGRSANGGLWYYDARPGGYVNHNLGGIVR